MRARDNLIGTEYHRSTSVEPVRPACAAVLHVVAVLGAAAASPLEQGVDLAEQASGAEFVVKLPGRFVLVHGLAQKAVVLVMFGARFRRPSGAGAEGRFVTGGGYRRLFSGAPLGQEPE